MSDKIELMRLCRVLQSIFSGLSQAESRTQPCHVRICIIFTLSVVFSDNISYTMSLILLVFQFCGCTTVHMLINIRWPLIPR